MWIIFLQAYHQDLPLVSPLEELKQSDFYLFFFSCL